jgi:hypothetical protein
MARNATVADMQSRRKQMPGQKAEGRGEGEERARYDQAVKSIIGRLQRLADDQASKRQTKEEEWIAALKQFNGKYGAKEIKDFADRKRSELFANQTRAKTLAWESRLSDLLFPTDDKNWGISPTAVPEISREAAQAVQEAETATAQANKAAERGNPEEAAQIVDAGQESAKRAMTLQAQLEEIRKRATRMEKVMVDQLDACQYGPEARDVIHDACKLGTGVLKGPITARVRRRAWLQQTAEGQGQPQDGAMAGQMSGEMPGYSLSGERAPRPEYRRVDLWNYFPDMSGRKKTECEFEFERYLWRAKDLRALARQPGYDPQAIRRLLVEGARDAQPTFVGRLRDIAGESHGTEPVYIGWEYHGPLDQEEIKALLASTGDEAQLADMEVDLLEEVRVIVWFCGSEVLKVAMHPLDSGDSLYSAFSFERDDASVFGHGIPFLMTDSQAALNGVWRMAMDNGAFSVGPQVLIDTTQIEPANNNWDMEPLKIWKRTTTGLSSGAPPFQVFNIPSNQAELLNLLNLALKFIDDEAMMPVFAQGEPGTRASTPSGASTASGLTLIMNSANVGFRRVVKNWDDGMTTPSLQRLFDWNMQFNEDESIKGDMEINARGSNVLLIREAQTANVAAVATQWSVHPVLGDLINVTAAARKAIQGMSIDPDEIIKSDEEIALREAQRANEQQPPPPEVIRAQAQTDSAKIAAEARIEVAKIGKQAMLERVAEQHNISITQLKAMLEKAQSEGSSKERIFASEVAVEQENAARDAARGEKPAGSGGYVSQ